jgi:hypothetical protein
MKTPSGYFVRRCLFGGLLSAAVLGGLSSCGGIVLVDAGAGRGQTIWASPARVEYEVNELFIRQRDLTVYQKHENGAVEQIPVDQVDILIDEDPGAPTGLLIPVEKEGGYLFQTEGRKEIRVSYQDMDAQYSVQVRDLYGLGGVGAEEGSGGSGILIEWED